MAKTYNIAASSVNPGWRSSWYENGKDYSSAANLVSDNKRNWVGKFNGDSRAVNLTFNFSSVPSGAVVTSIKLNVTINSGTVADNANYQIQYKKTSSALDWEGTGTAVGYVKSASNNAISSTSLPSNGLTIVPRSSSLNDKIEITAATLVVETATYTVSYNVNGGTGSITSQTKISGVALTLSSSKPGAKANSSAGSYTVTCKANYTGGSDQTLSAARTTTYSFANWNTAANGSGVTYASGGQYTTNASATLYAQWSGTTTTAAVTLPTLSRTGYTFNGWYDAASGGNKIGNGGVSYTPAGNKTLYAHWTAATYTISYNANGGTNAPASQTKTYGQDLTLQSGTPTRSDTTTNYTVTFNANDGSVSPSSRTATRTTTYSFSKWNTASDGSGTNYSPSGTYSANASATLYAQWTSSASTTSVTLPTPTRTGYTFNGWYTAASGGTRRGGAGDSFTPTANTTLYAQWTVITYTISYNKGTYGAGTNTTATKTYGVTLTLKDAIFTRTGYAQGGWSTAQDGTSKAYNLSASYTTNAATTLYPYWVANTYAVNYNANGGSGAPSAQTKTYGVSLTLSSTIPTRTGYLFQGWATSATGTATYRTGTNHDQNTSYTANAAVTLYAVWAAAASTVSTTNGTLGTAQTITITRNSSSYTHNLSYSYGSQTGTIATGVGTSYSWTPPTSIASAFPNATSGTCTITCVTKNGTTTIGTTTTTCTLSIPSSIKPSGVALTASHYSANSTVSGWATFTRGYSQADLSVTYTLNGGATLASITFSGPGMSSTGTSTTARTSVLTASGTNTWTVTVKDSRGRAASTTVSKTVYDYANPVISSIGTYRCDSGGTINNGSGTYVKFLPKFSASSVNSNNSVQSAKLKWRVSGGSWSSEINVTNNTDTAALGSGSIDITKTYEVSVTVTDKLNSTTATATLPSASGVWYGRGNDRLGLGGVPPSAGLHCDWDATFNGVLDVTKRRCYAASLNAGWYRVLTFAATSAAYARGATGNEIVFHITRRRTTAGEETHEIKMLCQYDNVSFVGEVSKSISNYQRITKIRYTYDGSNGYVDIYVAATSAHVTVDFEVYCEPAYQELYTSGGLADAPTSGTGTVLTEYTLSGNTDGDTSLTAMGKTWYFRKRNGVVYIDAPDAMTPTTSGSNSIGTLPVGFRPKYPVRLRAANFEGTDYKTLVIGLDGLVQAFCYTTPNASTPFGITGSYLAT